MRNGAIIAISHRISIALLHSAPYNPAMPLSFTDSLEEMERRNVLLSKDLHIAAEQIDQIFAHLMPLEQTVLLSQLVIWSTDGRRLHTGRERFS